MRAGGGRDADRHRLDEGLPEIARQPLRCLQGDLGIEHDVEVRLAETGEVGGACAARRDDGDVDAAALDARAHFLEVVAMTEAVPGAGASGPANARTS